MKFEIVRQSGELLNVVYLDEIPMAVMQLREASRGSNQSGHAQKEGKRDD